MIDDAMPSYRPDHSSFNRTEAALIARHVDDRIAHRLKTEGWTLRRLKQESNPRLAKLGLSPSSISALREDSRPGIPLANLARVFAASRFTCCVCHDPTKPIIVHHIRPWAESRDHSASNLALLCLEHHEQAHRTSTLARNLDTPTLITLKAGWEQQVRLMNAQAILNASRLDYDAWWYFQSQALVRACPGGGRPLAKTDGLVTADGALKSRPSETEYMYTGMEGMSLYRYVRTVMNAVLGRIMIYNISDHLDRLWLGAIVKPGDFVFVQGAHTFASHRRRENGPNQTKTGLRKANRVEIHFSFDCWEATSNSAWAVWLRGRQAAASIVRVITVRRASNLLIIEGSVLGISAPFDGLKERDYAPVAFERIGPCQSAFDEDYDQI